MITRGIRIRLILFAVMALAGVTHLGANYLGLFDAALGRGFTVTAKLPASGGLYEGSEVTYRGVKIGLVGDMRPSADGVDATLELDEGTELARDALMFIHNGSAVGEQYLDFEPTSADGPYVEQGDVLHAQAGTLPVDESDLITDMDAFVSSVEIDDLRTVINEVGVMFTDAGPPLQDIIDNANVLIGDARANQKVTIQLLQRGQTVLRTQQDNADNVHAFASGLRSVTRALADNDNSVRTLLQGGPTTLVQIRELLDGLQPTLPVLLSNLATVNQVVTLRLPSVEQLLVTYPGLVTGGFTGTTADGYGHVHLEFAPNPPPCTAGYLPPSRWRPGTDLTDGEPYLEAHCASGAPYNMRGSKYAPRVREGAPRVAPYDPATGRVAVRDEAVIVDGSHSSTYGGDPLKWMIVGPTVAP